MHENYKGSIELISGLKQKNNLNFPLMEANAVAVYEQDGTEVRLDEKLRQLKEDSTISEDTMTSIVESVTTGEKFVALSNKVDANSTAINTPQTGILDRISSIEGKIDEGDNQELKIQFEEKESMLYLFAGDTLIKPNPDDESVIPNVISSTGISGGGGSGASLNYSIGLTQLDSSTLTFLHTDTPKIKFHAKFIDTSVAEGEDNLVPQLLNFKMTVTLPSGAKNVYTFTRESNIDLEYDLTQALSSSTGLILGDHSITLTASYTQEIENGAEIIPVTIQSTKKWTVKITEMYLTSNFEDAAVRTGDVPFSVTVYGDLNKTIHYNFGGQTDWRTLEAPMSNYEYSITIPKQAHGNYPLEVYLLANVNGKEIKSNSLFFDIMFKEDGNNTPIIRAVPSAEKGQQYSNFAIEYSVYTPSSLISEVELAVDGKIVSVLDNVDRSEKVWNYKSATEGLKVFTIKSGSTVRTLNIEIEKIPYTIEPVTAGLDLDFVPQGRTNQDADYNVFKNNAFDGEGNEIPITWTLSENFDWVNGGWKVDENEDSYFCVKAGTSVDINYLLFNDANTLVGSNQSKGNGKEFKIIFKTANVANASTTWLSCLANPEIGSELGLQMDAHTAYVKTSSGTNLAIPYSEEDKIEFDMNIVPISYKDGKVDLTTQDIPMIMTYEDGTPVRPLVLTDDTITFKHQNAVPITIGSPYCDVHIYRIKAYSTYLSDKNILNNFIADASNAEEMIARYERNQIYDAKTGKLTPESFAAACPHMRVIKISAPRFTNDKKDKVLETEVEMIYKNGDPLYDNWKAVYARHNGQGTSSNAYGYAGRNLELSLKEKETLRYKITKPDGVYDEDGELLIYGTIVEGKQDFFLDEALENKVEDASTVATVTTIPGTTITLGDGSTTAKKVSLTRDSVPTNYFNIKVNIASSEQANNALLQKRYDRYLPYTSYAAANDEKVKNNMNFYNCVIFIQERNTDLTTHQEFNDNEWHFYSMGNIGDSKKTDDSRANDPDDTTEFCVEIMDWNRELSAFPQDTKVRATTEKYAKKDKDGNITGYIFINEDNLKNGILFERDTTLKTYQEQVDGVWQSYGYKVSADSTIDSNNLDKYYVDILEQDDYSEDYTYGFRYLNDDEDSEQIATAKAKWNEFYRFITRDNYYDDRRADASGQWLEDPDKIAAWKTEFENWFIKDAAFYYYLFTLRYTMVDNRAKNSFWHWGKCLDGKYRMDFWDYDNDTALGIDNTGKFTMSYGVEDHDVNEGGAAHFRAHNSTFFVRVADYYAEELITYYKDTLENNDATVFSSTSLINEFDAWQSEFPEELWRCQYERIYKRTYVGGYGSVWDNVVNPAQIKKAADPQFLTEMMNGKKKYQRRQFERNQDVYMSSKFFGQTNFQDMLTLRGGGDMDPSKFVVKPNGDITITPYLNMYINVGPENNKFLHHVKAKAGEPVTLKYPTSALEFNYIWGGSYLQSLGDLSPMYLRVAKLGQGQRLKQLILGNPTKGYNNPNLDNVEITANNKLLEELDVRNMSTLTGTVPIRNIASLRKLYAQGTSYQTVAFANSGLIEEAYLPSTIHTIVASNLYYLHTLQMDSYENLKSLLIDNCPKLKTQGDDLNIVKAATNLKTARLTNIEWHLETTDVLNRLYECSGIGEDNSTPVDKSVLTGYVYVDAIRQTELDKYAEQWPKLEVHYGRIIQQFNLNFYNEGADEPFFSYKVDTNTTLYPHLHDPIQNGMLTADQIPTKPDSEDGQWSYEFEDWSPSINPTTNASGEEVYLTITADQNFFATFAQTKRKYTVTWYGYNRQVLETQQVEYGAAATYTGPTPTRTNQTDAYFLFGGWEQSTAAVTHNMEVTPIWLEANPGAPSTTDSASLHPVEIYSLAEFVKDNDYNNYSHFDNYIGLDDEITVQLGYMPDYENVESIVFEDAMKTYKGIAKDVVVTDQKLFEDNQSFTLAIDFTFHHPAKYGVAEGSNHSLISCITNDGSSAGFSVLGYSSSRTENKRYTPYVQWKSNAEDINATHVTSEEKEYREIVVLQYSAADNKLRLYTNDRFSIADVKLKVLEDTINNPVISSIPLSFGGRVNAAGSPITSTYATGEIHYAKLWKDDLGEEECKKICSWVYDTISFERVDNGRYYIDNSSRKVTTSFVATKLLDEPMMFNATSQAIGWDESTIRTWLNNKMLKAFAPEWQLILQPTTIYSLSRKNSTAKDKNNPTEIELFNKTDGTSKHFSSVATVDKLYLPALSELHPTLNNDFIASTPSENMINYYMAGDKGTNWRNLSCYPQYLEDKEDLDADNQARIKQYPGVTDNIPIWMTRTPSLASTKIMATVTQKGQLNHSNYYYDNYEQFKSLSMSSPIGVVLAFSI